MLWVKVGANSFRGQESIPRVLGLLVQVLLARLGETSALAWPALPERANKVAWGNRYRKGSAGDQPGPSDATTGCPQFPTPSCLPLQQVSSDISMK